RSRCAVPAPSVVGSCPSLRSDTIFHYSILWGEMQLELHLPHGNPFSGSVRKTGVFLSPTAYGISDQHQIKDLGCLLTPTPCSA
ncbi:MAG: hypothetical protein II916_10265, partial [Oscillospiraceae bacterium]|nr:hypothetical protein [Oscillospiraceae bacterium]